MTAKVQRRGPDYQKQNTICIFQGQQVEMKETKGKPEIKHCPSGHIIEALVSRGSGDIIWRTERAHYSLTMQLQGLCRSAGAITYSLMLKLKKK